MTPAWGPDGRIAFAARVPGREDADVYLVKVRSLVANHTYLADSESITVAQAATSWLEHCEVRCQTGRRMERSTLRGCRSAHA